MNRVQQLTRRLTEPPPIPIVTNVSLRTFLGSDDVARWLELRERAFAREKLGVRQWNAEDFSREFLSKPWWRPEAMWFAEERSAVDKVPWVVGTVTLARRTSAHADVPVVHWLAVLPSYRRRGIGRLLMATLESACWQGGDRQVWLETHAAWSRAMEFYRALGYEPDVAAARLT